MLSRLSRRLLILDPGLVNLQNAITGTLAAVASFLAVSALTSWSGQPPALSFLSVLIVLMGAIVIYDSDPRRQKGTTLLLPLVSSGAFVLGIGLQSWPGLRILAFLMVTFVAVSLRNYGPRWTSLGVIAFVAFFASHLFDVGASSLPWAPVSFALSSALLFVFRFVRLRADPARQFKRFLMSFDALFDDILKSAAQRLVEFAEEPLNVRMAKTEAARPKVRKLLARLSEISLMMDDYISVRSPAAVHLPSLVFNRELLLRRILDWVVAISEKERPEIMTQASRLIMDAMRAGADRTAENPIPNHPSLVSLRRHLDRLRELSAEWRWDPPQEREEAKESVNGRAVSSSSISTNQVSSSLNLRQAIQATIATGLASWAGAALSADRWYWATVAAFFVFVGASRGETMMRAAARLLGTIAGLAAGFLLASFLPAERGVEWIFIVLGVFTALFGARYAFGFWTAASFALMVALLFDLLGQFSREILILRLEETLVGAFMGALVGSYVLPSSTTKSVRTSFAKLLRSGSAALTEVPPEPSSPFAIRSFIKQMRQMDRDLIALRAAAAPIAGRVSLMRKGDVPLLLHDATGLVHFMRQLLNDERSYQREASPYDGDLFRSECLRIARQMDEKARSLEEGGDREKPSNSELAAKSPPKLTPVLPLQKIEQQFLNLAKRRI